MAKIYAGIVLYNPDIDRLKLNITAIAGQVELVVLVDNGSANITSIKDLLSSYTNTKLIENGDNLGIAKALNQILEEADKQAVDWVLTLDQDSICPDNMMAEFSQDVGANIGMICPRLDIIGWNVDDNSNQPKVEKVNDCITSGALTSVNAWRQIGGFNEDYFIDLVDSEFSLRMKLNGFDILRDNAVSMTHEVGESIEKKIGPLTFRCTKHTPIRCYYMVRNHLAYTRQYKQHLDMFFERKMLVHKVVTSIMVADNKCETIKMMCRAKRDYKNNKFGKLT